MSNKSIATIAAMGIDWQEFVPRGRPRSTQRDRAAAEVVTHTPDQVAQLIKAAPGPGLKHKAALTVAYGAGLCGCEVVRCGTATSIPQRMLIRVEMGKGCKDRHACCRPRFWSCCEHGGCNAGREAGSRAGIRSRQ